MKKFLSILLAVVITATVFTALPFTVSAAETKDVTVVTTQTEESTVTTQSDENEVAAKTEENVDETEPKENESAKFDEEPLGASSGTTGDCTWTLDDKGTLTISGDGLMDSYTKYSHYSAPWGKFIKNVIINKGVKNIGGYAFYECSKLTSVSIPDSVISIGEDAFLGCTGLTSVYISEITVWCRISFSDTSSNPLRYAHNLYLNNKIVTDLNIPDDMISIADNAFYGCTSLKSVTIPDSVTSIGKNTFAYTGWYNNQPDGLVYAGKIAYKYKGTVPSNTTIVINDGTKVIADSAFYNCTSLASIDVPESVTRIENNAFYNCTSLVSIDIPESVTRIGNNAFYNCTSLTSVTIPDSVNSIGEKAFGYYNNQGYNGDKLSNFTICCSMDSEAKKYAENNGFIFILFNGSGITGDCLWFLDDDGVLTIIGEGVMGDYSTRYTSGGYITTAPWGAGIKSVVIESGVTSTGVNSFYSCKSLTNASIANSVTNIGDYTFCNCSSLTNINIPNSMKSIGDYAFASCIGLAGISLPNTVTNIGDYAFSCCTGFINISIPDSVTSIGDYAFERCTGLTDVAIGNGITSFGSYAFSNCTSITNINIPNSVTSIGLGALYNCTGLTSISIPDSVSIIDGSAFSRCTSLKNITIPDSVTSIGNGAFYGCISLTNICIPDSVTCIGDGAFKSCNGMTSVTIPSSVVSIGKEAFGYFYNEYNNFSEKIKGFIIYGFTESEAEAYADRYQLRFMLINGSGASGECTWSLDDNCTLTISGNGVMGDYSSKFSSDSYITTAPWGVGVKNAVIENGVTRIGKCSFYSCKSLASVIISDNVTSIGDYAFLNCSGLMSISIPNSVTNIGVSAFYNCANITNVVIPNNVTNIGDNAFYNCTGLTSVTIPDSVTSIGDNVFYNCPQLTLIIENNTLVMDYAQKNNIPYIFFSSGTTGDCKWLYSNGDLNISGNGAMSDSPTVAPWGTEVKGAVIESGVTNIRSNAFFGCTQLTDVTIPESVTSIGKWAFYGCKSLNSLIIPESVTNIGEKAFYGCANGFTIYGYKNTVAERYANENNIPFVELEKPVKIGDSNGDGNVDVLDAAAIQKFASGMADMTNDQQYFADVNNDGVVDILDAADIQKFAVGIITEFKKKG